MAFFLLDGLFYPLVLKFSLPPIFSPAFLPFIHDLPRQFLLFLVPDIAMGQLHSWPQCHMSTSLRKADRGAWA